MLISLLYFLAKLGLIVAIFVLFGRRIRRAREEQDQRQHDQVFALSQRCDHLQEQIDRLAQRSSVDQLHALVTEAREAGALPEDAAQSLGRYILRLGTEVKEGSESDGAAGAEQP